MHKNGGKYIVVSCVDGGIYLYKYWIINIYKILKLYLVRL